MHGTPIALDALRFTGRGLHRPECVLCGRNVSSLAFGGPDGRTAWLGCLLSDSLATFRSPVAGLPPSHWEWT
jgi:hypothetical protein